MPIVCNVPFSKFRDQFVDKLQGSHCLIKIAIGTSAFKIPRSQHATARISPDEWGNWLFEVKFDKEIIWKVDNKAQFISDIKSFGKGDSNIAAAIYYRMHYHTNDLSFAHAVDHVVFTKKYHELFKCRVFEDQELAPNLSTPEIANLLHFSKTNVSIIGRKKEQAALVKFLEEDGKFRWLQIAGVAGQGKSRLAYDLIDEHQRDWHAGFLNGKDLIEFGEHWHAWQPKQPTLIIIDYVLGQEPYVKKALQSLAEAGETLSQKVRLLLVERQRWDRGGLERPASLNFMPDKSISQFQPSLDGHAEWFLNLCDNPEGFDALIEKKRSNISGGVVELKGLSLNDIVSITKEFLNILEYKILHNDDWIKETLIRIDKSGRPLFAYILAVALVNESIEFKDQELRKTNWTREGLLKFVIERERNRRWVTEFGQDAPQPEDDDPAMRLALLATMVDGYDNGQMRTRLPQSWGRPDKKTLTKANIIVDGPRGRSSRFAAVVPPLQPDLLGEWFVLSAITANLIDYSLLVETAWRAEPKRMAAFLERCTQDFPLFDETLSLLEVPPPNQNAQDAYGSVCASIFINIYKCNKKFDLPVLMEQLSTSAAQSGDAGAMSVFGYCKLEGFSIEQDVYEGARLTKLAAKAGYSSAMFNIGVCYEQGKGVAADPVQATEWFRRAAEAGHSGAKFNLGVRYDRGEGVAADPVQATEWFRKAAEAGDEDAMFALGVCYVRGNGVAADPAQATEWFRRAAEAGHSGAKFNLGIRYQLGEGTAADPVQATEWFRRAAEAGDEDAMFALGVCYEQGKGVTADPAQATEWLRKAAEAGAEDAMFALGVCYDQGNGVAADPVQATEWFRSAAVAGHSGAMFNLGVRYHQGESVAADPVQATEWFRRAAEAGHSRAMFALGVRYDRGNDIAPDPAQATERFRRAAEAGHSDAMFALGVRYDRGKGITADPVQAMEWFRRAAGAGNEEAQKLVLCFPDRPATERKDISFEEWAEPLVKIVWPMEPLIPGDWKELPDTEIRALVRTLACFSHLRVGTLGIVVGMRYLKLDFYPTGVLVEVLFDYDGVLRIACLLSFENNRFLLNGNSYIIHHVNKWNHITINNSNVASIYLRFFSAAIHADLGNVLIVDELMPAMFYDFNLPEPIGDLSQKMVPLEMISQSPESFVFSGSLIHGHSIFNSEFRVFSGLQAGHVEMIEHNEILSDLPLFGEGFDGVFRCRRRP